MFRRPVKPSANETKSASIYPPPPPRRSLLRVVRSGYFEHLMSMEAVLQKKASTLLDRLSAFPQESAIRWSALCQELFDLERKEMLEKQPTREDLAVHRKAVKWLIRLTHVMLAAADPDEPTNRAVIAELEGRLIQLKHSWRQFQEPMAEGEAEQLTREFFPE